MLKRIVFALLVGAVAGEALAGGYANVQFGVGVQFGTPVYGVPVPVAPMYGIPVYGRQPVLLGYRLVPTGFEDSKCGLIETAREWCFQKTTRDGNGRIVAEYVRIPRVPADLR